MTYTPAEARKYLRIAEPTLSRYCRLFAAYLSPKAPNRHRRYTQTDLMTLSQIRSLARQGKKLKEIPQYLTKLEELSEKDDPGPTLQEFFEDLKSQMVLLAELMQAQDQAYKKLLKIEQQRTDTIFRVVKRLQTVEEKISKDALFLFSYKKEFEMTRNLVYDHVREKHNLAGFLGL